MAAAAATPVVPAGMHRPPKQSAARRCAAAVSCRADALLARGEVAALAVSHKAFRHLAFKDAEGRANACAMARPHGSFTISGPLGVHPAEGNAGVDALETTSEPPHFEVVAVNRQPTVAFLKEVGVTYLAYYADPSAKAFQDLKLAGKAFRHAAPR